MMYMMAPPRRQLSKAGLETGNADSITDKAPAWLRSRKKDSDCNISAQLLKAGREAMIHGRHPVLTTVWIFGTIIPTGKLDLSSLFRNGRRPPELQQLRVLVERKVALTNYVDLKKAVESVHRTTLRDLTATTDSLLTGLHSETLSVLLCV